jgi:hypothetical protein
MLPFVVLAVMVYWLWRVRATRASRSVIGAAASEVS